MRLAILADVHGNLPALETVLADVRQQGADGIVVAGDLVTGGPQSPETIGLLRSLGAWMIRGNGEDYLVAYDAGDVPEAWRTSEQWGAMRWSYLQLDREALDYIASLPEQRVVALDDVAPIRVVHGSPRSPSEHLFPDRDQASLRLFREAGLLPPGREPAKLDLALAWINELVLVCGHSHIPWKQKQGGRLVLNPGSVGAPINGDPRAQYALLTWQGGHWEATHRAVAYDLDRIRAAYSESGMLAAGGAFTRACLLGIETGQNVPGRFVAHVYRLAAEAGFDGGDVVPDAIWERALATFDWEAAASGGAIT